MKDVEGLNEDKSNFHIVSYGLLSFDTAVKDSLRKHKFGMIVIDESHMMKDRSSKRTKELLVLERCLLIII